MIDAEGSKLLADVFNTLTEGQENIMPEDVAERIERFMTANGFRMVFSRWYLQCEPEVKQEPVAWLSVDCIGERYLCFSKPVDNDLVTPIYTFPPDAQAEIAKRDKWIKELEQELQTTADALAEVEQIRLGLENVRLFAARHRKEDWALLILGFCSEAGVVRRALR